MILERDGQPVQRSYPFFAGQTLVGLVCKSKTTVVVQLGHDGVDLRIDSPELVEMSCHHLSGGQLPFANQPGELASTCEAEVRNLLASVRRLGSAWSLRSFIHLHCHHCSNASLQELASPHP